MNTDNTNERRSPLRRSFYAKTEQKSEAETKHTNPKYNDIRRHKYTNMQELPRAANILNIMDIKTMSQKIKHETGQ